MAIPKLRFPKFEGEWNEKEFGDIFQERREKTKKENEEPLISCAIDGLYLNSELFTHFRGKSNLGYIKIKMNDLILSAQNLHLGNVNVNTKYEKGMISPAYKVYEIGDNNPFFVNAWAKMDRTKRFYLAASTEGASQCRKNIEWNTLEHQLVSIPSCEEQQKIGSFFNEIDNYISLNEKKLIELQNLKKSLMQKMFPKAGEVVPEIRFPGFEEEWKTIKISDIGDYYNTASLAYADLDLNGKYKCILYGDLYTKYNEYINNVDTKTNKKATKSEINDILFPTSTTVDAMSLIAPSCVLEEEIYIGGDLFGIRPKNGVDGLFVCYEINNIHRIKKNFASVAQGSTITHIQYGSIREQGLLFPSFEEQQKISLFFKELDNRIELQKQKLEEIKEYKKGLLQQMFC